MSDEVTSHYEGLLAEHYTWMFGVSHADKVSEQQTLLSSLGVPAGARRLAVDLGAGPGFQSLALAQLGFERVLAVDTSARLLDELRSHVASLPIETMQADVAQLSFLVPPGEADTIVCMGDTLTHLESLAAVVKLFHDACTALSPDGLFVLSFRDLSNSVSGLERFLPIRSDDERVMTCVLDYEPETVLITDLIYVRQETGWRLNKSCYRKLRLAPLQLEAWLEAAGFDIESSALHGHLWCIVAKKA